MITKLGKQKLEKDLENLQNEYKNTLVSRGIAGREGDLKENAAYISLGEKAEMLGIQMSEAADDLKKSVVQEAPTNTDTIGFGHKVTIFYENDKREMIITLVGKNDARIKPEWISIESPIGQALTGKKVGDKIVINEQPITILNVQIGEI